MGGKVSDLDKFKEMFSKNMGWFTDQSYKKSLEGHLKYPTPMWEYDIKQIKQHLHEEILDLNQFWIPLFFKIDELVEENKQLKEENKRLKNKLG